MSEEIPACEWRRISDRGYVLDQGTVHFENDANDLLDNPEVGKCYLSGYAEPCDSLVRLFH